MNKLNILIIANHSSNELNLLTVESCIALLPIGGKPLIEHTLEAISKVSPETITIVAARGLGPLRSYIENGTKWGLNINVVSSRPNETVHTLKINQSHLFESNVLILECNRLFDFPVLSFLEVATDTNKRREMLDSAFFYHAINNETDLGIQLFCANNSAIVSEAESVSVPFSNGNQFPVRTLEQYHQVNLLSVSGEIKNIQLRGKERSLGLRTGYMNRVHPRSLKHGRTQIGNHCQIHSSCSLSGNNVINSGVVIDRNTSVENSLILDHTFIGENLEIKDAILSGNLLIRVDTGAVLEISDRFLTAKLGESMYDTHFADITHRLIGVLLTLITIPLWPLSYSLALICKPKKPVSAVKYLGNKPGKHESGKKPFKSFQFNVGNKTLRNLPITLSIANGDLRLVGVSICKPHELEGLTDSWQTARDTAHSGVLGPTQLYLGSEASLDERLLNDTIHNQKQSLYNSMIICWQSLLAMLGIKQPDPAEQLG